MNGFRSVLDAVASKAPGRRRRRIGVRFPTTFALQYKREISAYTRSLRAVVNRWVEDDLRVEVERARSARTGKTSLRADSADSMRESLDRLEAALIFLLLPQGVRAMARKHAVHVIESSKRQWARAMKLSRGETPYIDEAPLDDVVLTFVVQNESLIDAIPRAYHARIMAIVTTGVLAGKSFSTIRREIQDAYPSRVAGDVAVNQMGTLAGAVSMELHRQASLSTYVWCDNRDERVRGNPNGLYPSARYSHWHRNGKVFRWANPPPDGHPGYAKNCRCWAALNEEEARGDRRRMAREGESYDAVEVV